MPKNTAAMALQYAEDDPRVKATKDGDEAALKAAGVTFNSYVYPGTKHGFHNNSTPRYNADAAKLAWERTVAFFHEHLDTD